MMKPSSPAGTHKFLFLFGCHLLLLQLLQWTTTTYSFSPHPQHPHHRHTPNHCPVNNFRNQRHREHLHPHYDNDDSHPSNPLRLRYQPLHLIRFSSRSTVEEEEDNESKLPMTPSSYGWSSSSSSSSSISHPSRLCCYCERRYPSRRRGDGVMLWAAKKNNKKNAAVTIAALEALEALERLEVEENFNHEAGKENNYDPSSVQNMKNKKEILKLQKQKQQKLQKSSVSSSTHPVAAADPVLAVSVSTGLDFEPAKKKPKKKLSTGSKKEQMLANALALEDNLETEIGKEAKSDPSSSSTAVSAEHALLEKEDANIVDEALLNHHQPTLEDKIRKDRPPPRIRVMDSAQPGYTSLRLENVGIVFRNQAVLRDVSWGVNTGDRVGLVGANGAGKTTQIRILAGELEPTTGDVVKSSKDLRVAVLRQEFIEELDLRRTLKEEMLSVFALENQILADLLHAEFELENTSSDDPETMQILLDRMQDLQNRASDKDVYSLESRVKKVMDVMGFADDETDDLIASFSGGWKMRIGLGKVLLKDPNVLLLDEPTNHLDLDSVVWLESFLREQKIPMVIVSHDREFLDQVCTRIVDAEGGICTEYDGNYSRFLQLKKARMDAWNAAYNAQEKKIREERQWINQFRAKQPQAVKQREAKLEKLVKSKDYVQKPPFEGKPFRFRFPDAPRLSPEVSKISNMSHAYRNEFSQNRLFANVDLSIEKGDRIAIVGPNGSGKSTLLRLLVGRENPDEGSATILGQNVVMNYFEQNQADALDLNKTVLETIQGASSDQSYNELRALLGQFLFKGDAVDKRIINLSGGEKARLSLASMMLRPANFLVLDEPTNHLDIPAKEMLEEALQNFDGSVLIVSHDRYFISKIATTIVAIEDKQLIKYPGDFRFYMERSEKMKEKIESRYVNGVEHIGSAPIIEFHASEESKKKKSFGGAKTAHLVSRKDKGIKNVKRIKTT